MSAIAAGISIIYSTIFQNMLEMKAKGTRCAPAPTSSTSYQWNYNPYKWSFITLHTTSRDPSSTVEVRFLLEIGPGAADVTFSKLLVGRAKGRGA